MAEPLADAGMRLIACILHNKNEIASVDWVEEDYFLSPHQGTLWGVIREVASNGTEDVLVDVLEALNSKPDIVRQVLHSAVNGVGPMGNGSAGYYAERLALDYKRRLMLRAAHQAVALIEQTDPGELDMRLRDHWDQALNGSKPIREEVEGLHHINDFVNGNHVSEYDWVIPGLLEKQERFVIVAPVKSGKSVMTRQIGLCLASGRHPFDPRHTIPRQRVLMLDLENPAGILRRDLKRQMTGLKGVDDMWVLHQPAGVDLGSPKDRRMVEQAIIDCRPDLVIIGPLYKTFDGLDQSWEMQAAGVQKPIDYWRSKYGCAFLLEHHASKSDPTGLFGSSRWARWFDAKVALIPEDPSLPPPHRVLEWSATYRDTRRMAPEYIEMRDVLKDGDVSWVAKFVEQEGFGIQLDRACWD